jgi:exodeoxyribonuclease VII small subunit
MTEGSELSYEQARAELASVVERLEAGGASLEESLALWERGEHLAAVCQRWLDGARARLDAAQPDNPQMSRVDGQR